MNRIVIALSAMKDLGSLRDKDRETIVTTLERLQQDPFTGVYSEQLITRPEEPPIRVARAGSFRIFFRYQPAESMLQVLSIAKAASGG